MKSPVYQFVNYCWWSEDLLGRLLATIMSVEGYFLLFWHFLCISVLSLPKS